MARWRRSQTLTYLGHDAVLRREVLPFFRHVFFQHALPSPPYTEFLAPVSPSNYSTTRLPDILDHIPGRLVAILSTRDLSCLAARRRFSLCCLWQGNVGIGAGVVRTLILPVDDAHLFSPADISGQGIDGNRISREYSSVRGSKND